MKPIQKAILKDVSFDDAPSKPGASANPVDHWPPAVLLERAAYLRKLARHGDGSASETLLTGDEAITCLVMKVQEIL